MLAHMKEVPVNQVPARYYFIPHHCVLKPENTTTKIRVLFNASAKSSSGKSLIDILYAGPVVQNDFFSILLRFRTHIYEKMYRQIWVNPEDQFHQWIIWRNNPSEK